MEKEITIKLNGLHCASCIMSIEMELEEIKGVRKAEGSYAKSEIKVEFNEEEASPEKFLKVIKDLGYEGEV
ncbi:MAG: hypothetical protein A3J97_13425 [Spirochaetes bacterium RIFOXYC1_FULL_54_7]|nr:MAG: hypothetical protein A3J97_13425 [Spirochaetes bacterium RIFOXYC1_FULL_54_7]